MIPERDTSRSLGFTARRRRRSIRLGSLQTSRRPAEQGGAVLLDLLGLLARHPSRARRPIMFTEKAGRGLLIVDLEKDVPEEMNRRQIAVKTAVGKQVEADVAA